MSSVLGMVRSRAAYLFIVVGVVWAALGFLLGSVLAAWPTVACLAGGALLMLRPLDRLTWAWGISTAAMGLIVSLYQIYAWGPLVSGAFSTLAAEALAGFTLFALVHVLLFYAGAKGPSAVRRATS
jgi:hypothetical protein